jgi:hypothetical protein
LKESRAIAQRRDEIVQDAKLSLAEFREGKLKIQSAAEAISELQEFIKHEFSIVILF